ncbi:MAG: AEC family transporter [Firmicutes bacterium]|nr:AEC family transporter [Bacillota bacterium]
MELSEIVFVQGLIIFVLMALGFVLAKTGIVNDDGTKQMTDILLFVVTPCVLIRAYQMDFSFELVRNLLIAAGLSLLVHIIGILLCTILFRKEETLHYRIDIFASVYSNCGFMAIPLLTAAMGTDGVFYGSAYLAVFTILYWTHGICVYSGSLKELSIKKIITNPGIVGTLIALLMFALGIKLPYVLESGIDYMAEINTPLAMIVMGAYLTKVDFKKALKNSRLYLVTAIRLIIFPMITIAVARLLKIDSTISRSIIISSACPTAAVSALLATKYRLDSTYAAEIVSVCTILSIATIPMILMLY